MLFRNLGLNKVNVKAMNLFSAVDENVDLDGVIDACEGQSNCSTGDHGNTVCPPFNVLLPHFLYADRR